MSFEVVAVTAGGAHEALAAAVAELKGGAPLKPVAVIVPTNAAGVMARRRLAASGGVAAIDVTTLYRLAERIAGPEVRAQGRLPVSTAVVELAVRAVLADESTAFDAVAEHPSTAVAVRDLYRQLRLAGPSAFDALAGASRRGKEVASVARSVRARLTERWYDEADLVARAAALVASGDVEPPGDVVVFMPQATSVHDAALLRAIAGRVSVRVVLALTGHQRADREPLEAARMIAAGGLSLAPVTPATSVGACRVVSLTDADEEARFAARAVVDAARVGTRLGSIAILWPVDRPYARLVEHHLDQAGIAWNGRPGTLVSERIVPRFVLDLLAVDRRDLRRRDVFDLLADLPIRSGDGAVPVAAWERVSRDAGIARDEHWAPRLRNYAAWQRRRAEEDPGGAGSAWLARSEQAEALDGFVAELRRQLGRRDATRTWAQWADWCEAQIDARLGDAVLAGRGEAERQAWEHTSRVLDRLRHLDAIGAPPTRAQFRAVFAAEFDVAPGRLGRIGNGVTIGSLSAAPGLTAEVVILLGAADGVLPPAPTTDPLLGDGERVAAGLPTSEAAADRALRQFLAVAETARQLIVTHPRGDLRATTVRQSSRWLAHLTGRADAAPETVASHGAALLASPFPASEHEHRLRRRLAGVLAAGPDALVDDAVPDAVLQRGLALRAARRTDALTVYDGDLSGVAVPRLDRPVSPTQLQAWAACPHAYFVQYLLGVRPIEEPGDEIAITPADRGNVVHEVLDLFHREVIAEALPQPGEAGWTAAHLVRLAELLTSVTAKFERSGRAGRAAYWELDRTRLVHEIAGWADHDSKTSRSRHSEIVASEARFGVAGDVTVPLPGGRRLAIHGSVDRIDRTATGLVVSDHKTGSADGFTAIGRDDPTAGATLFQLPAYAAAALALTGADPATPVCAEYSFLSRGGFARVGYELDEAVWERVAADLGWVVSGVEAGFFPATPARPQFEFRISCQFCQPDALGTAERFPEWDRKRHDPRLAAWFADDDELVGGEPPGGDHGAGE